MLPSRTTRIRVALGAAALLAMVAVATSTAIGRSTRSKRASATASCAYPDTFSATRDPSNPLDLPAAPGPNPLSGAQFFIAGPAHGSAAGAIATLVGLHPKRMADSLTWGKFLERLQSGPLAAKLGRNPGLAHQVALLEKIASGPEANRFSLYSGGGGPGAIYGQVHKILCHNLAADPGTVPIFTTFFLYQAGYCESAGQIIAHRHTFERQVNEVARGIDRRPAVMLLELDAIGASKCMQATGALPYWEADIRYEVDKLGSLPHTVVYVEGGYADGNSPAYTARALRAVDVGKIRGFFTNDTHEDWTIKEIQWAQQVSRLVGGAHFIVNTATNGQGPLVPRNRVRYGNEVLCNPPGRGLGPLPTTAAVDPRSQQLFTGLDALLWTAPPGNSSGSCDGGPPAGTFWTAKALGLAARANGKLGPGYPSRPF